MRYASGKYALGHCDRCDFPYPLNELRKEWNGYKVCPICYEPKHPQLKVRRHQADAETLREARPGIDTDGGPTTPWTIDMSRPPPGSPPPPPIVIPPLSSGASTPPVASSPTFSWDDGTLWDQAGKVWS